MVNFLQSTPCKTTHNSSTRDICGAFYLTSNDDLFPTHIFYIPWNFDVSQYPGNMQPHLYLFISCVEPISPISLFSYFFKFIKPQVNNYISQMLTGITPVKYECDRRCQSRNVGKIKLSQQGNSLTPESRYKCFPSWLLVSSIVHRHFWSSISFVGSLFWAKSHTSMVWMRHKYISTGVSNRAIPFFFSFFSMFQNYQTLVN